MITIHIKETAEKRKYKNAHQLAVALGVADNVGVRLWNQDFSRIDLITLDRLCRVLRCQPNQLFKFVSDESNEPTETDENNAPKNEPTPEPKTKPKRTARKSKAE